MSKQTAQRYQSYLLRLWQTSDGNREIWRASLEDPGTRERRGFGSLKELYEFLDTQAKQQNGEDADRFAEKG
jgi:hypothetical protein